MTSPIPLALRRVTTSSVVWYTTVISGWGLLVVAITEVLSARNHLEQTPALVMTATLLIILELLPLVQGRGHDPQGVVMSTAFVCSMLFMWGVWPAITMVVIASVASDLRAGKNWWKTVFNPAQYALSIAAGGLVIGLTSHLASLSRPLESLGLADLWWVSCAWLAYFTVNLLLVAGVLASSNSFRGIVFNDFRHYTTMSFAVLALSPVIVVVGQHAWQLLPLLLIPLLLLYHTAAMSLDREHAAGHDALTGLPNRTTLQFELNRALSAYRADGEPFGLMLLDLDNFKQVNDTLGHEVGDNLLIEFAERLRRHVRQQDRVARLGGDEFAVVVLASDRAGVVAIAERIRSSVAEAVSLEGISLEIEVSIGIALCPDHGVDATALLRGADVAMYFAKEKRSRIEVYSPDRDDNTADRLALLGELRQALLDDEIELFFQPKVRTADGAPIGVEALVRWRHPLRGYIAPDEFIPLAERSGIMPLLTERVVRLAVAQTACWREQGMVVPVAINVSPTDLVGDELVDLLTDVLHDHDIPPGQVTLEITERVLTHRLQDAERTLSRLRAMGILLSLDDFGTGYSSLQRLSSLQVDEIKIDRGFVAALTHGDRAVGIVRSLVDLASALGMCSIAEGVETEQEFELLKSLKCGGAQGWHIARPMPAGAATEWLRARVSLVQVPAPPLDATRLGALAALAGVIAADAAPVGLAELAPDQFVPSPQVLRAPSDK